MQLVEVRENNREEYNRFVSMSESGSFLQAWEWGEWQNELGRQVFRFKILDAEGDWIGCVQFIKHELGLKRFYLYAPYGPVTDFRFKIEDFRLLIQQIYKHFPAAIFVRMEPKDQVLSTNLEFRKTKNIQPGKTLVIDLTKPEEELLAQMHSKTRYNIRLAEKHGIKISDEFGLTNGHGLFYKEALEQIADTSKRQGFKSFPVSYYRNLTNFFAMKNPASQIKAHLYKAVGQDQLLASGIYLDFAETRTYLFGGSSENHKNLMAPYLMHFKAMQDAKNLGMKYYDFWGLETAASKVPGFVRFKQGFGGGEKLYAGAFDFVLKPWSYKAYQGLRTLQTIFKPIGR
jgi:lipid II:glycine glycyltransferase (peptidoglycan interpeptide bridge formation enzyme)